MAFLRWNSPWKKNLELGVQVFQRAKDAHGTYAFGGTVLGGAFRLLKHSYDKANKDTGTTTVYENPTVEHPSEAPAPRLYKPLVSVPEGIPGIGQPLMDCTDRLITEELVRTSLKEQQRKFWMEKLKERTEDSLNLGETSLNDGNNSFVGPGDKFFFDFNKIEGLKSIRNQKVIKDTVGQYREMLEEGETQRKISLPWPNPQEPVCRMGLTTQEKINVPEIIAVEKENNGNEENNNFRPNLVPPIEKEDDCDTYVGGKSLWGDED